MSKKPNQDMHSRMIVAHVKIKTGKSLRELSISKGYGPTTLQLALQKPYPAAEEIIAAAIQLTPQKIWPSRFNANGSRKDKRKKVRSEIVSCTQTSVKAG